MSYCFLDETLKEGGSVMKKWEIELINTLIEKIQEQEDRMKVVSNEHTDRRTDKSVNKSR